MSAAELLHGLQPACASSARCKPAAMGQCARGRQWWCRRDAPAHRHRHRQTRHVHLLWSRRIAHRSRQPAQPSHTRPDDMVLPHLCCRNTNSFDRGIESRKSLRSEVAMIITALGCYAGVVTVAPEGRCGSEWTFKHVL